MSNYCGAAIFALLFLPMAYADSQHSKEMLDPTRPLGYSKVIKKESLILQAIFVGGGRKEAIINGVAVKEGGVVAGKKIVAINKSDVVFESNGARKTLKLRPSIFKK